MARDTAVAQRANCGQQSSASCSSSPSDASIFSATATASASASGPSELESAGTHLTSSSRGPDAKSGSDGSDANLKSPSVDAGIVTDVYSMVPGCLLALPSRASSRSTELDQARDRCLATSFAPAATMPAPPSEAAVATEERAISGRPAGAAMHMSMIPQLRARANEPNHHVHSSVPPPPPGSPPARRRATIPARAAAAPIAIARPGPQARRRAPLSPRARTEVRSKLQCEAIFILFSFLCTLALAVVILMFQRSDLH